MKKALTIIMIIIAVSIPFILNDMNKAKSFTLSKATEKDKKMAEEFLTKAESMRVYRDRDVSIDVTETTKNPDERIKIVQGELIKRATYSPNFVVWKGGYPAEIALNNGETKTGTVSCYGHFFSVDSIEGYFKVKDTDQKNGKIQLHYRDPSARLDLCYARGGGG